MTPSFAETKANNNNKKNSALHSRLKRLWGTVRMCVCVCTYMCVFICVYTWVHLCMYMCICILYVYVFTGGRMYIRVCSHKCAYVIFILKTSSEVWFETHRKGVKRNCFLIQRSIREAVETLPLLKGGSSCTLTLSPSPAKETMVTILHVSFFSLSFSRG